MPKKNTEKNFKELVKIVSKLRAPGGCPWDREQSHETLKPFMVEETYEAIEAIDQRDFKKLCEELGDQLLHVVMHAEMAQEDKKFDINDVIDSIKKKMIRRHPHVFGKKKVKTAEEVLERWEKIKQEEKREAGEKHRGILESIPQSLPALYRADKIQRRAARVGFDWNSVAGAWDKVYEEIDEVKSQIQNPKSKRRFKKLKEEIGDLLFAVVNVARKLDIDAEEALQNSSSKFMRRFKEIECQARAKGKDIKTMPLKEMDRIWEEIKRAEE
ncbi:MAG: nucleoside triphosphate pyrophosphohydrolase [Candidatus Saganbacteria bacterium]|nr:nucleoside triphosphate pyrophosphohydrolase [Candidatus Saganbacteria bacterium]